MTKAARRAANVQEATLQETAPATAAQPEATTEKAPEAAPQQASVQLTIADLQILAQAIEIASSRGAYRAGEMGDVGAVFNRLTAFLAAVAKQRQEAAK